MDSAMILCKISQIVGVSLNIVVHDDIVHGIERILSAHKTKNERIFISRKLNIKCNSL